jgi:hypothetical protein
MSVRRNSRNRQCYLRSLKPIQNTNIPCARPSGSDPAYLAFEFEPTVPGAVRLQGTNFCAHENPQRENISDKPEPLTESRIDAKVGTL